MTPNVICAECGTAFYSCRAGASYNAAKYCSDRCFHIDYKRKHPDRVKASRRKTHLNHRAKDNENNRAWWRKNRAELLPKRAQYQRAHKQQASERARKRYADNDKDYRSKERKRALLAYYLGHKNPKGDLGWLKRARTTLRNAQRQFKKGISPEACVSQRLASKPDATTPRS